MMAELRIASLFPELDLGKLRGFAWNSLQQVKDLLIAVQTIELGTVESYASEQLRTLLSLNIAEHIAAAWVKHAELLRAGRDKADSEYVALTTHALKLHVERNIELLVSGVHMNQFDIPVMLELKFGIDAGRLRVEHERIVEIRAGQLKASGELKVAGQRVAFREVRPIDISGGIVFSPGIPLTAAELNRFLDSGAFPPRSLAM